MTVNFRGYLFKDNGEPLEGAPVHLLETGTTTVEATTTTDSAGGWSVAEADQDRYDIKITSGTSVRYIRWDDQISLKEIDVRNNTGATTPAATFTNLTNNASNQVAVFSGANSTRADGDEIYLSFKLADSAGNIDEFARMTVDAADVTSGEEDGQIRFGVIVDGTMTDVFTINSSESGGTDMTLDVSGDLTLDADGGDILFKDGGTTFGSATNTGGNLIIKSGTTTSATFSGANVTFAGTVDATTDFTIGSTVITDDSIVMTPSTSDTVTIAGATHGILNVTTVDAAGTAADVNIDADGEIVIDAADAAGAIFKIAGTAQLSVIDGAILPTTDNDIDLGSGSYQFKDAYVNGTLEADAVTIGGTNVVTGSLVTTLGTISAGVWQGTAITGAYINDDIISGQAEITSGLAAADELLYSDAGTVKRVGVDTLTTYLAGVNAGTVTSTGRSDSSGVITLDIQNMTASSTIADADLIVIDDGAGGTLRKMTRANFIESAALDAINIDGGAIDGAVIGANSAAAGTFAAVAGTTGTFSGILKTDDATEATSTTDGSLQTDGGLSVVKDAVFGDDLFLLSDSAVFNMGAGNDFTITHDGTTGATLAGSPITITSAAAATWSTSGGALTVNGTTGLNLQEGGATIVSISNARVLATSNTASVDLDASGAIQINSSGGAISIGNDNIDQTVNLATAGTRTLNIGIDDNTDLTTINVNGNMIMKGVTPVLTIGDAGAEDATLLFDGNAVDYHFGLQDDEDGVVLGKGTSLGTTPLQYWDYGDANSQLISFGTTPTGSIAFKVGMTHASSGQNGSLQNFNTTTTLTPGSAGTWNGVLLENTYTISSGTVANIYNCRLRAPTINNSGTISGNTANLFVDDASSATVSGTNYALLVNAGVTRLTAGARIGSNSTNNLLDDGGPVGSGSAALHIGNEEIQTSSDSRLKTDIRPTSIDALSLVDKLDVVDFEWDDPTDTATYGKNYRGTYTGMVAQDTVKHAPWIINDQGGGRDCPSCTSGLECQEHGMWHVQYDHLVPTLVKAIQELKQELREVKNG